LLTPLLLLLLTPQILSAHLFSWLVRNQPMQLLFISFSSYWILSTQSLSFILSLCFLLLQLPQFTNLPMTQRWLSLPHLFLHCFFDLSSDFFFSVCRPLFA
jgi:hypothetical protein